MARTPASVLLAHDKTDLVAETRPPQPLQERPHGCFHKGKSQKAQQMCNTIMMVGFIVCKWSNGLSGNREKQSYTTMQDLEVAYSLPDYAFSI